MTERRINPITGRTILYATERGQRPKALSSGGEDSRKPTDPACPFCGETTAETPVDAVNGADGEPAAWSVANAYPILRPSSSASALGGYHEVLVESPRHHLDLADFDDAAATATVGLWSRRVRALAAEDGVRAVTLFRNRGAMAGATQPHPHSQVVASRFVPPDVEDRTARIRRHRETTGHCLVCDVVADELYDGRRLLVHTPRFAVFVPWAAEAPGETWIVPTAHPADFAALGEDGQRELGPLLAGAARRLRNLMGDPDYNALLLLPPVGEPAETTHWALRLLPRHLHGGGFEIASGLTISPELPETSAARLRSLPSSHPSPTRQSSTVKPTLSTT